MRALKTELAIFESCLDGFWSRLLAEGSPGVTGARLALEFSDKAMKEHQKVVARLSKSNGGLFSSLRMVLKKGSVVKHVRTLGRARSLIMVNMNMPVAPLLHCLLNNIDYL
jgi:hypothetical protein